MIGQDEKENFVKLFGLFQTEIHQIAKDKGWWKNKKSFYENPVERAGILSLVGEELFEAIRELRQPEVRRSENLPNRSALVVELADIVIRVMDFAEAMYLPLGAALIEKMEYNKGREKNHGGKRF